MRRWGTIRKINDGYGFIQVAEDTRDRFFHAGSMSITSPVPFDDLEAGDIVKFHDSRSGRDLRAENVTLIAKDGDVQADGGNPSDEEEPF